MLGVKVSDIFNALQSTLGTFYVNDFNVYGPRIRAYRHVFSDRFTALRKQLVATSLRGNPAPGCAEPPVFTLEVVSPEKPTSEGSAWEETHAISCKGRVRRTFLLFLSVKEGMKHSERGEAGRIERDFQSGRRGMSGGG